MSTKNIALAYYNLIKLEKERAFYGSGIFSRDAAAKQANVSKSSFSNYLKLNDLYQPLLDEIDKGTLKIMVAYELAFIPVELQKYIYDQKYYENINRSVAKKIRHEAKTFNDVDKIISDKNKLPDKFNYNIELESKLPEECEILPLFVNKNHKSDIFKMLDYAIKTSHFPELVKSELLKTLNM